MRTFSIDVVDKAIDQVRTELKGQPVAAWLDNTDNIALTNGRDVALFEYRQPGVYTGHYFFLSRGKDAVLSAEKFIEEAFTSQPIHVIIGMTPMDKPGALWMNKRLGFQTQEEVVIDGKLHRVVTLMKDNK